MKFLDVIKYEGDNSTFVWKHPCEDFTTKAQLIVHETQEAILLMDGKAADTFGPGRYTLDTKNIPILTSLMKKFITDGETPFHCEVYYINQTVQMSIKWGTDSKVRFIEPNYGIPLEIGACGEMNLAVSDSKKLLTKLVGTMNGIAWGSEAQGFTKSLQACFRPMISTAVKTHLSSAIKTSDIDLFEIDSHLETLSEVLRKSILPGFEEYGLTVPQFYITNMLLPEGDPNFKRMKDLHTLSFQTKMIHADTLIKTTQADANAEIVAAQRKATLEHQTTETEIARREAERELIRAQAQAQAARMAGMAEADVMAAKGYSQRDVLQADVQKAYAEGIGNMNISGGAASDLVGLSVGLAAAGAVAPQIGEMFRGVNGVASAQAAAPATSAQPAASEGAEEKCAKCGAPLPKNAKFCFECGEKVVPPTPEGMVVCPDCGKTVAKGKFCFECGHKFITNCPKCGAEITSNAKFCLECGEKL